MFQTIPISVIGPTYQSRSLPLSAQTTRNLYPEVNPVGKSQTALHNWPGEKAWFTLNASSVNHRGAFFWKQKNKVYFVQDETLYSIDSSAVRASIGAIAGGSRCIFETDGTTMVITTGATTYTYDGTTLSTATDADLETPTSVSFLNSQMIYDGDGGRFAVSDAGSPVSINGLNYATAESSPDDTRRGYVFKQTLYVFGDNGSIEPWYNTGVGNPPFDRVEGGIIPIGLHATHSLCSTKNYMYLIGSGRNERPSVYRISSYQEESIADPAIAHFIEINDVSDCVAWTMRLEGQDIVVFQFPTADKTLCYSETLGVWFEVSSGTDGGRHIAGNYIYAFDKHLVFDYRNGNIYEWDLSTYTSNGATVIRQRDTGNLNGGIIKKPGKRLLMSRFELIMQVGVGLNTGQGSDPYIMFSASTDGGRTWSNEDFVKIGQDGAFTTRAEWFKHLAFHDLIIRFKVSDPVFISVHNAAIDVMEYGGHG